MRSEERVFLYVLYDMGEVVYIGQTISLEQRLRMHRLDKRFDAVKSKAFSVYEIDDMELEAIRRFKPRYNKQGNGHEYVPMRRYKRYHANKTLR